MDKLPFDRNQIISDLEFIHDNFHSHYLHFIQDRDNDVSLGLNFQTDIGVIYHKSLNISQNYIWVIINGYTEKLYIYDLIEDKFLISGGEWREGFIDQCNSYVDTIKRFKQFVDHEKGNESMIEKLNKIFKK
jgi:hypothetical protein